MGLFVDKESIVRKIWGKADTILFIFAGAAAEFALNKAVDWLYFTGRLPSDPLGRLFSTVSYARQIVFSEDDDAFGAIDKITTIHKGVEQQRGTQIPEWAYRDVLFMLIDYSIRSFELLERKLTEPEKHEVFRVFQQVGSRMGIPGLPGSYHEWQAMRENHLRENLEYSDYTKDLYQQYKKHLGISRYHLLIQAQVLVVPERINFLLSLGKTPLLTPLLKLYKVLCILDLDDLLKKIVLPRKYQMQIKELDILP